MATLPIADAVTMDRHTGRIMRRVDHHAANVEAVIPALRGYVETYGKDMEVDARNGDMKNVTRFKAKRTGISYCLCFDHNNGTHDCFVRLHVGKRNGNIIARFDNSSTLAQVLAVFKSL